MRRLALNLLRQDKSCKAGANGKRLKACLEQDYLLKVLAGANQMRLLCPNGLLQTVVHAPLLS
jgi:hypothetical protein